MAPGTWRRAKQALLNDSDSIAATPSPPAHNHHRLLGQAKFPDRIVTRASVDAFKELLDHGLSIGVAHAAEWQYKQHGDLPPMYWIARPFTNPGWSRFVLRVV